MNSRAMKCGLEGYDDFLENSSHFVRSLLKDHQPMLKQAISDVGRESLASFWRALRMKAADIYTRRADIEAGDNVSLNAVQPLARESIQSQLDMHHFGNQSLSSRTGLENIINLTGVKTPHAARVAVVRGPNGDFFETYSDPEFLADFLISCTKSDWITTRDTKQVSKSLEGCILLLNLFALEGIHDPGSNKNAVLLVLNMATFSGRNAQYTPISALTRNGIGAITEEEAALKEAMYEDCANKIERRLKAKGVAVDNLKHPNSRLVCGMPSGLGVTSFDLITCCRGINSEPKD